MTIRRINRGWAVRLVDDLYCWLYAAHATSGPSFTVGVVGCVRGGLAQIYSCIRGRP